MELYPSLIDRLKTQHEALPIIISNLSKSKLELNPVPGKWSIKDNIAHLAKYQPLFIERMHKILNNDGVAFERYSADLDPEFPAWQIRETDDLLIQISIDRKLIQALITGLQPEQLSRTGIHPLYGKLTIVDWTEFFLLHEAHHLFTVFKLVRAI
jgi:hypothetical protein